MTGPVAMSILENVEMALLAAAMVGAAVGHLCTRRSRGASPVAPPAPAAALPSHCEAVLDLIREGVVVVDRDGVIVESNVAARRIYGLRDDDAACRHISELSRGSILSHLDGSSVDYRDTPVLRLLRGEALAHAEYSLQSRNPPRTLQIACSGEAIPDASGAIALAVLVIRDLTELRSKEVAAHRANELFETVAALSRDAILVKDVESRCVFVNPSGAAMLGKSVEAIHGRVPEELYEPESAERVLERNRMIRATGATVELETTMTPRSRSSRTLAIAAAPLRNAEQRIIGSLAVYRDHTAQRAREQRTLLLDRALQAVGFGIILTDATAPGQPIIYASRGFELLSGYSAEECVGRNCRFLQGPDTDPAAVRFVRESLAAGRDCAVELLNYRKNGRAFWNALQIHGLRDEQGRLTHHVGVQTDVTPRRLSDRLLESVLNGVGDAVLGIDAGGSVHSYNHAATTIFRCSGCELIDIPIRQMLPELPGDLASDSRLNLTLTALRRDGEAFPAEVSLSGFVVDHQNYFTIVVRDFSEKRKLEAQYYQAQKMEAVGQLAAGVAHDFNNLLTIINGYSEHFASVLAEADPLRVPLLAVREAGQRATWLTRQLLTFSRQSMLEPRILDLHDAIAETGLMLRRLVHESISIETANEADRPLIKADAGQISQLLMNLVLNAADAIAENGTIAIALRRDGPEVVLSVRDSGTGMTDEVKARLFEPFFTTKLAGHGTGLGLATVYGIVQQHQGRIEVRSELGRGTEFEIRFPAVEPALRTLVNLPGEICGGSETVLLVEDETEVRTMSSFALKAFGYVVHEAAGADEALAVLESLPRAPDLLLTDVVLRQGNGRQLADRIRQRHPEIAVLYVSGYTSDALLRHGVRQAEVAFLQKPFTPITLTTSVRQALDARPR